MTQQIINVGSAPNDGLGDPIRTAFIKTNDNFTELYATGGVTGIANGTSNVRIPAANSNVTISVDGVSNVGVFTSTGANLVALTTAGNITAVGNISGTYYFGNGAFLTGVGGGGGGQSIANGTSNVNIPVADGNVEFAVGGTANIVTITGAEIITNGVFATPKTLANSIVIGDGLSAMRVSPLTIPGGLSITVPSGSTLSIVP
jgi:hypothetical protein